MRLQSLRTKLLIANILPALLFMPILSLYLLNTLEGFYTQERLQWLAQQGSLILAEVHNEPAVVEEPAAAQAFLADVARSTDARVLLLSEDGTILGSSRPVDRADRIGMRYMTPAVEAALRGATAQGTGQGLTTEVAYVVMPVQNNGTVVGVMRLSYEVDDVRAQFAQLRWLVVSGTMVTALLASALGLSLARTLTSPIGRLVRSIQATAAGNYHAHVEVERRDEIGILATSFNEMATRLADAESARQQQLAAIVHELARPLTSMSVAVEALIDGVEGDGVAGDTEVSDAETHRRLLAGVGEEVERLKRLLSTLQILQKQAVRPVPIRCAPLAVDHVACASMANFEPAAERAGVTLAVHTPTDLAKVMADEDRMIQVLTNLLDNALKFTPDGGCITVEAENCPDREMVRICVADTGPGIAPDELPHVFEQFYRGGGLQRHTKGGLGLGLTICQQIVTAHGGEIWVESNPGHGARFLFTLPALGEL